LADGTVEGTADGETGFYGVRGEGVSGMFRRELRGRSGSASAVRVYMSRPVAV
jgi:hypothetical protein